MDDVVFDINLTEKVFNVDLTRGGFGPQLDRDSRRASWRRMDYHKLLNDAIREQRAALLKQLGATSVPFGGTRLEYLGIPGLEEDLQYWPSHSITGVPIAATLRDKFRQLLSAI